MTELKHELLTELINHVCDEEDFDTNAVNDQLSNSLHSAARDGNASVTIRHELPDTETDLIDAYQTVLDAWATLHELKHSVDVNPSPKHGYMLVDLNVYLLG